MDKGKSDLKDLVLQELKENPYRKFNIAFSLMTIIPFLVFFYILISTSSLDALAGQTGGILFICLVIAVCGFSVGYVVINNILRRLFFYATKLKHSDQLKSTMVASVSHELKNPITIIRTNLDTLSDGLLGTINEAQKEVVGLCLKVTDRMTRLITDLLDIHKIEAGMIDMQREQCNLAKLLESQVDEFGPIITKKGIKLITELLDTDLIVWADGGKITQVINNLLSNAIKYTPDGQSVTITAYPIERFVRLEVTDRGPGIPTDKLEKVFDKFERLDHSREGTGLGLSIAKDIVELHKGRIWVESFPGKGSTFVVVLPRDLRSAVR
ncbi:MAG: HAMP domain-containing sensor histidine kinase [Candidatus Omnitrophica bacterium]|nr:HAMP domain-containing sensor histidine kinase [Candidatus Omnitrophota bacterium]MDD5436426.1 HAMP domain-containing sensor histidine kinase [Candidatus Omnitrophota bacterium]